MICELEMIHQMDHRPVDIPEQYYLYQNLLRRGWLWKMPAKYQAPARILMECDGVLDSDFKEIRKEHNADQILADMILTQKRIQHNYR